MRMVMKTRMPQVSAVVARLGLDEHGKVQKAVTQEVFGRIKKYMPRKSGTLQDAKTRIESDTRITVEGPYARAQFFGVRRDGTTFDYDTRENPQAGPHWDRRLAAAEGRAIAAKVERAARKAGRDG